VAVITTSTPRPLDAVLSPTVAVALENERLMVLAQAQLDELRRSREEIVARADSARRQLERDLHDGAQQRLLAISVLLGEDGSAGSAEAAATARTALDELRRIAHGLYPVVLDQFGLVEALRSLADEAPLAVELSVERGDRHRLPIEVEQLLYRCVRTVVTRAAAAGATVLEVALEAEDDHRSLGLQHDARVPVGTIDLADRVGAVGGRVTLSTVDGRQHVQVEL
jgi:signal transduction histidine kinase